MGADDHPTRVPSNFDEVEGRSHSQPSENEEEENDGENGLYHLWVAETHGGEYVPSFIYIRADSLTEAHLRAQFIGVAFNASCACQMDVRPVEVYV
ncbi:hypothetical protein ACFQGT_09885 [Natrialbaceae archaeon GCM10025810]|uniref:hypothetical protein n=1 Tax=Halovalidus salilacus TaxID=3075124 RepID=UPI0036082AB6